jgi:uncharacterized protein YjbI with pentapeptide repeats
VQIEIKNWSGNVLHTIEADSLKAAVEALVKQGCNLRGVYLEGAYLEWAYLGGAYLEGANLRGANLEGANLRGVYLRGSNLRGANLEGANLEGANLRGANLEGANLRGANLEGANYGGSIPISKEPITITGLNWHILILDQHMKIGCELHNFADWEKFKDSRISKMDHEALEWWKIHKAPLIALIAAVRPAEDKEA